MRLYMPQEHRWLVNDVASVNPSPKSFVDAVRSLLATSEDANDEQREPMERVLALWEKCLLTLREFRTEHIKIATQYIVQQSHKSNPDGIKGTGGTSLVPFLRKARDETQ